MKRIIASVYFALILMGSASATTANSSVRILESKEHRLSQEDVTVLTERLKEIHKLSKTNLTLSQRQELREEVLSIREKLTDPVGGGIYISAGALILIIILLIIIL